MTAVVVVPPSVVRLRVVPSERARGLPEPPHRVARNTPTSATGGNGNHYPARRRLPPAAIPDGWVGSIGTIGKVGDRVLDHPFEEGDEAVIRALEKRRYAGDQSEHRRPQRVHVGRLGMRFSFNDRCPLGRLLPVTSDGGRVDLWHFVVMVDDAALAGSASNVA